MSPGCAGAHLFAGKLHSIRLSAFRQQLRKHKTTIYCVPLTKNTIYDGSFFLYLQAFPAFHPAQKLLKKNFFPPFHRPNIFSFILFFISRIYLLYPSGITFAKNSTGTFARTKIPFSLYSSERSCPYSRMI